MKGLSKINGGDRVDKISDGDIVQLYFDRNETALLRSQEKYGAYCYSVGYNILYSNEDAEECVNETWLKAWNSIPPKNPVKLGAFLGKITRCIALDRYKSSKRQKRGGGEMELVLHELDECIPDRSDTEEQTDMNFLREIIDKFLLELSQKDKAVFVARYYYAKPIKEISQQYGLNINTVKSSLLRSRQKMKRVLESEKIGMIGT